MYSAAATACIFRIGQGEKIVKQSEKGGDAMADLLAALTLLTLAGVVGLVAMIITLYAVSAALESAHRAKKKDNNE